MSYFFITLSVVAVVVVVFLINWYIHALVQLPKYKRYWEEIAATPIPSDAIKVVALGDSLMQGLGADVPQEGLLGRIVEYVERTTNRPVATSNLSHTGAKVADVVAEQLPHLSEADLYVVTVGSNDSNRMSNLTAFEKNMDTLLKRLPADRTIVADIGFVGHRAPYQAVIEKVRSKYGTHEATLENSKFTYTTWKEKRRFLAKDFFHPSSYGYTFWFEAFRPVLDEFIALHKLAK